MKDTDIQEIREFAASILTPKRLSHTLSVEKEALSLAEIFSLDGEAKRKVSVAALLHDITKELDKDEHIALAEKLNTEIPPEALSAPDTLHAITGAAYAAAHFPGLVDEDIENAIRYHTTGRAAMTVTEEIIFISDYIEPGRKYDGCKKAREHFYRSIDSGIDKNIALAETILISLDNTLLSLLGSGSVISPDTLSARNYYINTTHKS